MGNAQTSGTSNAPPGWNEVHGRRSEAVATSGKQIGCVAEGSVEYAALDEFLQNVRSDRVRSAFYRIPESEYTSINEIRIWASTFNLNGRKPPEDLDFNGYVKHWESCWPKRDNATYDGSYERADLYVMGFQEAVPLNAQNIIAGWTAAPVGWDNAIDRTLNPWKTEEELVHSPKSHGGNEASLMDYYVSGWSGVPSANLEARVKNSFAEGTKHEALKRRGDSCDEKKLTESIRRREVVSVPLEEMPDLISLEEPSSAPKPSPRKPIAPEKMIPVQDSAKQSGTMDGTKTKKHEEFMQLFGYQLVGLYVTGWVRKSLLERISGVQVTTVATGALGYLANKGAISVRLRIDDSAFVFVTSHLASGSSDNDQIRRNLDFSEIVRRTQFPYEVDLVQITREDGEVVEDFSVRPDGIPENAPHAVKRAFVGGKWGTVRNLRDLDNIIWVGDLNYRIKLKTQEAIKLIRTNRLNKLLDYEQLSVDRAAGKVFQNFVEAPIDFPPTYKFIRGTGYYTGEIEEASSSDSDQAEGEHKGSSAEILPKAVMSYPVGDDLMPSRHVSLSGESVDARDAVVERLGGFLLQKESLDQSVYSSVTEDNVPSHSSAGDVPVVHKKEDKAKKRKKKVRTPAWTDRILWYSSTRQLHQLLYGCFEPISLSDHKPVIGTFLMEARRFDLNKVDNALQNARRNIDNEEMASIPKCKLSPTVIDAGNVYYAKPVEYVVTVQNIGEVPAVYSFVPTNVGPHGVRSPFPKWLTVHPKTGVIKAGKKEQLRLKVSIEGGQWGSADELFGQPDDKLDHILVLHVEGGSDFFISIMGTYTLSSFGLSLKNLALQAPRDETPVRRESKAKLPSMRYRERGTSAVSLEVPVCEESSLDFDDHFFTRSVPVEPIELKRSTSLAATGPKPNLLEGPTGGMIPSEVSRMLYFLAEEDRLRTKDIFVESFKQICKAQDSKSELPAVARIRDALDQGVNFPNGTSAHDMASALFMFFFDLPSPMIPESLAQSAQSSDISAVLATSLLKEAMSAIEWSVFDSTMEVMRSALVEENIKKNQLTEEVMAKILSQVFFQEIETSSFARSSLMRRDMSAVSSRKAMVDNRRCAFIQQFLKLDKPLIDLEVTPSEVSFKSS